MRRFPARLGILGGGQLGRFLGLSCFQLGIEPVFFLASTKECAGSIASRVFVDDGFDDILTDFLKNVDCVTFENEFFDLERLKRCLGKTPVFPTLASMEIAQNKLLQKLHFKNNSISSLPHMEIKTTSDLNQAISVMGSSIVLKSSTHGYDGKGTFIYHSVTPDDVKVFFERFPRFSGYVEPLTPFLKELAVVAARTHSGKIMLFPVAETYQKDGICEMAVVPTSLSESVEDQIRKLTTQVLESLDVVGVFAIEMFLLPGDRVVVNEIAPRVHNSGHYSMNGCSVSQFDQHVRAVMGFELIQPRLHYPYGVMLNILGETNRILDSSTSLEFEDTRVKTPATTWVHWYGKVGPALKRKLGHINMVGDDLETIVSQLRGLRQSIKV